MRAFKAELIGGPLDGKVVDLHAGSVASFVEPMVVISTQDESTGDVVCWTYTEPAGMKPNPSTGRRELRVTGCLRAERSARPQ